MKTTKPSIVFKIRGYIYIFIFLGVASLFVVQAMETSNPQPQTQSSYEDPKSKKYKSLFQRFKDQITSSTLSVNILNQITRITTGTSCNPKGINQLLKKSIPALEDQKRASCICCIAKEMARKESYQNSVAKCQIVSKYCDNKLPFKDESQFFEETQILSLNQNLNDNKKINVSDPSVAKTGTGIQDVEYLRYIWNLPDFYVSDQFTPGTYKLKFLEKQGYIAPNPNNMRTSTNPYNHHYNKDKAAFFNPWPNSNPPIALLNAASGMLGALDIKEVQRPWFPQRSYTTRPSASIKDRIRATMIGHATVLLQVEGFNILTDPLYFDIGGHLTKKEDKGLKFYKRIKNPGISFNDLPEIHFVVISHNHVDHLDIATLIKIEKNNPKVNYITPLGYTKFLRKQGINTQSPNRIFELDWWDNIDFPNIRFTALPTQHWCGRNLTDDTNKMLWAAYAIKTRPETTLSKLIYFAGDTGFGPHFDEIAKKYPYFDLSLIPLGAYCPMHKEGGGHINPHEAVKVHQILKSKQSMGIHFDTFQLAQEPYGEAKRILEASMKHSKLDLDKFVAPDSAEYIDIHDGGKLDYHKNQG